MIITIQSEQGTGKSTLAQEIVKGKEFVQITELDLNSPFWTKNMTQNTEFIIVDEVIDYAKTAKFLNIKELIVRGRNKSPYVISMPNVILIVQYRDVFYTKYDVDRAYDKGIKDSPC